LIAQSASFGSVRRFATELDRIVPSGAVIEKVAGKVQFAEGPGWSRSGGYRPFSDIPANAIMKWTAGGEVAVFWKPVFAREFELPEIPANCAWGDSDGKTLYMTARTGLNRAKLAIRGARP
jgi:sugar lactone lactonase YvrE